MKDTRSFSPCLPLGQADGLGWGCARVPLRKIPVVKNDFIFSADLRGAGRDFCNLPDSCMHELFPD